ncbi:unnamed protein product [Darwinula stevensoni]|uniref:Uncharacterized protein n=1 Tax=Darwinula stevensoni TaxID=69355 RepID=A0A7R9A6X6_9CRUS|nr:unnamed protein product [Darwinula stevensoni]CAG0895945.1 unnamed protein product [Darwinula stevensoni]
MAHKTLHLALLFLASALLSPVSANDVVQAPGPSEDPEKPTGTTPTVTDTTPTVTDRTPTANGTTPTTAGTTPTTAGTTPTTAGTTPTKVAGNANIVQLPIRGFHIVNIPWRNGLATIGSPEFDGLCAKIDTGMAAALAGTSERAFYLRTVCLSNRKGNDAWPIVSDFNLEFARGVNLSAVRDDMDGNTGIPEGIYVVGDVRTDLPPSGRLKANATEPPVIVKVISGREARLFANVTVPSIAALALFLLVILCCTAHPEKYCCKAFDMK